MESIGALVVGRRLHHVTDAWGGKHPFDVPVFVVTHRPQTDQPANSPFRFVTEGMAEPIRQAKEVTGDRAVGVAAGEMLARRSALA